MAKDSNVNISLKQGGDQFGFFDENTQVEYLVSARQLAWAFGNTLSVKIGQGAVSTAFSVVNLPSTYKFIIFSMTSTCIAGSACLCSGVLSGMRANIIVRGGSCASGTVQIYLSGCSLVTPFGVDNSKMTLYNSTVSCATVYLESFNDDEWSVIGTNGCDSSMVTYT